MSFNDALSARSLYDAGTPQPGKTVRNDPGELNIAGVVHASSKIYFGRVVAPFTLNSAGNKVYDNIVEATTKAGGIAVFSDDAITLATSGAYSAGEAISVMERGFIIMETTTDLVTTDTLSVTNGDGSGDPADIGKLAKATTAGYSAITNLKITKVYSSSLVEVEILGPMVLTAH